MTKRLDYNQIARKAARALRGVHGKNGLPSELVDVVYLRVSQIDNCAYCLNMHTRGLVKEWARAACSGADLGGGRRFFSARPNAPRSRGQRA